MCNTETVAYYLKLKKRNGVVGGIEVIEAPQSKYLW